MDNEHGSPNPLTVIGYQFLALLLTAGSFLLYSVYGRAIVPVLGRWLLAIPPVVFLLYLSFYWRKNHENPARGWYTGALTLGFAIGYFLSYGLTFLIATGD